MAVIGCSWSANDLKTHSVVFATRGANPVAPITHLNAMTDSEAMQFAQSWINAFNGKDADAVLRHFTEQATFISPKAPSFGKSSTLNSRQELADYWQTALNATQSIRFSLDRVVNDPAGNSIVIVYIAEIDGNRSRAAEMYQFDDSSKVIRGEAMYGAAVL